MNLNNSPVSYYLTPLSLGVTYINEELLQAFFMNNLAKKISNVSAGTEYKNDSSFVNYYYEFTGKETTTKRNTLISSIKERLQPGDIVVQTSYNDPSSLNSIPV